ncbi:MAG: replication-associated recombination protein A [Syntrophobacteraceae bacterium]|jgi:putative ATPase|nr:replication-associated recombination protein A [Syntrophobacteraceae bacterium]
MRQTKLFEGKTTGDAPGIRAPLAERMRPRSLDEFVGQTHLLGPGRILDRLLKTGRFQSFIFWGPPGCGKTTLAHLLAGRTDAHLIALSAVMAGTREIRSAVEEARSVWAREKRRTWLFMDEIHRLNKAQQDTLLPHVENGTLLLLGATTENPSFEVIRPLLSRAKVLVLEPLEEEGLRTLVRRALEDPERGLGGFPARLTDEAEALLFSATGGDARVVLNALEVAVLTTPPLAGEPTRVVDLEAIRESLQSRAVHYDKGGEEHFNLISALHKSLRGSDPDASLYWLARMLQGGEDPLYIARRLVRMASEDVGLADPFALVQAIHAVRSYELLGSPEGDLALAQAVVYLSLAPKSNAVDVAFGRAREAAAKTGAAPVPFHIRNAPTRLMKELGYGSGYRFPHDDPEGWVPESYLPDGLSGSVFYEPTVRGWEGKCRPFLDQRREKARKAAKERSSEG